MSHYVTAPQQPQGFPGRTYYEVTYKPDGSDWCGVVAEVQAGESEVDEPTWLALRAQNLAACRDDHEAQAKALRARRMAAAADSGAGAYAEYVATLSAQLDTVNMAAAAVAMPAADAVAVPPEDVPLPPEPVVTEPLPQAVWYARHARDLSARESQQRQLAFDIQARIDVEATAGVDVTRLGTA